MARWLLGIVAMSALATACAAPPPAKKKAAACDPAVSECTGSGPRRAPADSNVKTTTGTPLEAPDKAKPGQTTETPDETDAEPTETDPEVTPPDDEDVPLPTPKPKPEPGPMCKKLGTCCGNLRTAGITGSANQCDRTVVEGDEVMCDFANESYKTPDDYYDPVCS